MSWFKSQSVSVTNGSDVVKINDGSNTAAVKIADALVIGGNPAVEIKGVFATELRLASPWAFSSVTNSAATVMPTGGDFRNATEALRNATTVTSDNFKTLEAWGTEMGVVIFKGYDNSEHQSRTMKQMDADVKALEDRGNDAIDQVVAKYAQPKSAFRAQQDEVKQVRSGSGWDEFGLSRDNNSTFKSINNGLYTYTQSPNALRLGYSGSIEVDGISRTKSAIAEIDGVRHLIESDMGGVNGATIISLPSPADGTQVTDTSGNVRGSGKPKLDLKVDVDPKYGDVAADKAEAQSRAFEGLVKNGDFRKGTNDWTLGTGWGISNGKLVATNVQADSSNQTNLISVKAGETYRIGVTLLSILNDGITIYFGSNHVGEIKTAGNHTFEITMPSTESALFRITPWGGNRNLNCEIDNVSVAPVTESVITSRQDLSLIESWEEVMGSGTGEKDIYCPNGLPQYGASSYLGIPLVDLSATSVGLGYAKFGEWQEDADVVSKVAVWSTLSLDNKKKIIDADPNMYFDSELNKPVCARARARTVEGLGDKWLKVIDDSASNGARIAYDSINKVMSQGKLHDSKDFDETNCFATSDYGTWQVESKGALHAYPKSHNDEICDGDGTSHALPISLTQRLNDGAWHPSYNPWGTAMG